MQGYKEKKRKNAQGACIKWRRRREKNEGEEERKMEVGVEENQGRDSMQNRANKSTFIHTVSTNYQCIYSIPLGVPIIF